MTDRWLRWYDGTVRDGKMRIAAEQADLPVCSILGVWASLLEDASMSNPRGIATRGVKFHSMYLQITEQEIGTVWNALEQVGAVVINQGQICTVSIVNWDKRQFETDAKDPSAKERKLKWKQSHISSGTDKNATERFGTPETETETETDKKDSSFCSLVVPRETSDWPSDYREQFWLNYPRKKAKKAAFKTLDRLKKSNEVTFEKLMVAVGKIPIGEPTFIPHPATWLNQGRWDDEQLPGEQNGTSTGNITPAIDGLIERVRDFDRPPDI